ncbi:unnamed protein product [Cochlearia groenlandica]
MNPSQSSGSGSTASNRRVLCNCGKVAMVKQAWTDSNPGRRFYRCGEGWRGVCDFFAWYDVEKPHGWQKNALLEARDIINAHQEDLKKLREGGS